MAMYRQITEIPTSLATREGPLCEKCSNLDFQASFASLGYRFQLDFVIDVAASSSTCPLCSLTRRLFPGHKDIFCLLRGDTFSRKHVFMEIQKSHSGQTKLLCRSTTGVWFDGSPPLHDWPKDPKRVDFGPLKQKLTQCETQHGSICAIKNRMPVEGLRVYNCLTNKLEEAMTDTKYVALSYVWGSDPDSAFQKPPEQHLSIRDAIQVALHLGYKHIWVDQLCINQGSAHKMQQIQQMNRIYHNADLTIVAAAGDNSDFGIPGVQNRSRLGQECFKIGDLRFVETLQFPLMILEGTTWNSRAWTFQEEQFSHRLLVFTERAAWFSCSLTESDEGFESRTHVKHETKKFTDVESALARKTPQPPCGLREPLRLNSMISKYSKRSLTYPSDAVNAFSGILTAFKEANFILSHVWGTPIIPPIALLDSTNLFDPGTGVGHVKRNSVDGFIVGLMWTRSNGEILKSRHGIPSWSWAGWQGHIHLFGLDEKENANLGIEASIERTDGQVLTWSEFEGMSYLENQSHLISRFIRLKAWTLDVRFEYHSSPDNGHRQFAYKHETWRYAVVQMLNGHELLSKATILGEPRNVSAKKQLDDFKNRVYTGVCLFQIDDTSRSNRYVMLLDKVNGSFQRIGDFELGSWGWLRQTSLLRAVPYRNFGFHPFHGTPMIDSSLVLGLDVRMEEIRIG